MLLRNLSTVLSSSSLFPPGSRKIFESPFEQWAGCRDRSTYSRRLTLGWQNCARGEIRVEDDVGHEPFFSHSLNRFVYGPFDGFRILAFYFLPNPVQGFQSGISVEVSEQEGDRRLARHLLLVYEVIIDLRYTIEERRKTACLSFLCFTG